MAEGSISNINKLISHLSLKDDFPTQPTTVIYELETKLAKPDEDLDTYIHIAIVSSDESNAIKLINALPFKSKCFDIKNRFGQTPLHLSVITKQCTITRHLILKGCDVLIQDNLGNTALHIACSKGFKQNVKYLIDPCLIEKKILLESFQRKNFDGFTCLHLALQGKKYIIMADLFTMGADVNVVDAKSGRTILHNAVEANDLQLVKSLLSHPSINVNCETLKKETPIYLAYWRNFKPLVEILKANGATHDLLENTDDADD